MGDEDSLLRVIREAPWDEFHAVVDGLLRDTP